MASKKREEPPVASVTYKLPSDRVWVRLQREEDSEDFDHLCVEGDLPVRMWNDQWETDRVPPICKLLGDVTPEDVTMTPYLELFYSGKWREAKLSGPRKTWKVRVKTSFTSERPPEDTREDIHRDVMRMNRHQVDEVIIEEVP